MIQTIHRKVLEEIFFFISFLVAVATSFFIEPSFSSIDWKVIGALFALMALTLSFEKYHLLDALAVLLINKTGTLRKLSLTFVLITAFLAVFVTNDVALITIVPLTLSISKKANFSPLRLIIAETIAANLGSVLTPFGNPQNLYLFNYYHIPVLDFIKTTFPIFFIGLMMALTMVFMMPNEIVKVHSTSIHIEHKKRVVLFILAFLLMILGIIRILPFHIVFALSIFLMLTLDFRLLFKIDYFLLGTFLSLFIAIDNLTRIPFIHDVLLERVNSPLSTMLLATFSSQLISNVPSAILLSGFSDQWQMLLVGVSIGGLGTMIASLANLIAYKFYIKSHEGKAYKKSFYLLNGIGMLILLIFSYCFYVH
ncbi:MAG: anion permease [Clostridia bacterium]|nr:anion permease [Clostridia bacterium]